MPSARVQTQVFVIAQQARTVLCTQGANTSPPEDFLCLKRKKSPSLNWQLYLHIDSCPKPADSFENTVEVMSLEIQAKLPTKAHKALRTSARCLLGHSQFPLPPSSSSSSHTHVSTKPRRQELSNPPHPHLATSCLRDLSRLAGSDLGYFRSFEHLLAPASLSRTTLCIDHHASFKPGSEGF